MTYPELLKSNLLHLPVSYKEGSFKITLKTALNNYLEEVKKIPDNLNLNIESLPGITGKFVKNAQKMFIGGLLQTIDLYHDGKPAEAFKRLEKTIGSDLKNYASILKIRTYNEGESFFRMRIQKGNHLLLQKEMFHIPFDMRGRVATQRFSIPGFPCLYLGRTIYGCWEEMGRPDVSDFQVVRLTNTKRIKYLDLTTPVYGKNLLSRDIYHYFMTWPLIACCSVKVRDYSCPFRSEYIIPQLLLQWVRGIDTVDAIRFNSTHINIYETKSKGDFSNIVLPVKRSNENGFCPELMSMFKMTNTISWQMHENTVGGKKSPGSRKGFTTLRSRIKQLELIPGHPYPYNYSVLGRLEHYLDKMKTRPIAS